MELRTTFPIVPSPEKISYNDPVMFIGSCFATSVGKQFETGCMPVMINPSGTVYNTVSVLMTLDNILKNRQFVPEDLYNHEGRWIIFDHYTEFSSFDRNEALEKINMRNSEASGFLARARFLFITFGTARIYRWKQSGKIVSNCHRIPASSFTHELLDVDYITGLWNDQLSIIKEMYPHLRVIFTISPVRHWKDGPHGNHVSKSVLFLAVEKLLVHPSRPSYFPAYELVMDDLRDYRFYGEDMIHLSGTAVNYIWNAFCSCYFDSHTAELWQEVEKISRAVSHRIQTEDRDQIRKFADNILSRIDKLISNNPGLDLTKEKHYFLGLQDTI
jgi:hypothetical protein